MWSSYSSGQADGLAQNFSFKSFNICVICGYFLRI